MTKSKRPVASWVRPPVVTPPLIPCEGRLKHYPHVTEEYKTRRKERHGVDDGTCGRRSAVIVDGRHYCLTHGGRAALEYLMREES